jgi:hypothetical protein
MKLFQGWVLVIFTTVLFSGCSKNTERSGGSPVVFNGTILSDITYARNIDYFGNMVDLKLDVYTPSADMADKNGLFPMYLHVHGGGYITGTKEAASDILKRMGNKGYLGVAISYRIGWNHSESESNNCNGDSTELKMAIYRAIQDLNASLRFIVAHASEYKIDTNRLFIGGSSAGAGTVLNKMTISDQVAAIVEPEIRDLYGPIDEAGNNYRNTYTIKGQACMWGGMGFPELISSDNAISTIFFHGTEDNVAPYGAGTTYNCETMPSTYGSGFLFPKFRSSGVSAALHTAMKDGHDPEIFDNQFLVDNMSCFFEKISNGNTVNRDVSGRQTSCD